MYALRAVALCTWGTIPCARAAILARLEEHHRHLPHVKVHIVPLLVDRVRPKVAADEAVPDAIVLRVETNTRKARTHRGSGARSLWGIHCGEAARQKSLRRRDGEASTPF